MRQRRKQENTARMERTDYDELDLLRNDKALSRDQARAWFVNRMKGIHTEYPQTPGASLDARNVRIARIQRSCRDCTGAQCGHGFTSQLCLGPREATALSLTLLVGPGAQALGAVAASRLGGSREAKASGFEPLCHTQSNTGMPVTVSISWL